MEKQEGSRMILEVEESQSVCEWLIDRGLSLEESAKVLAYLECKNSFCVAILKVFIERRSLKKELSDEPSPRFDWCNPITP